MTNREKWEKEILDIVCTGHVFAVNEKTNEPCSCSSISCKNCLFIKGTCMMGRKIWCEAECEEPKVDWSKVPVDTPMYGRDYDTSEWMKRHFAKYENGYVYAWNRGETSWTQSKSAKAWLFGKLAEKGDEE